MPIEGNTDGGKRSSIAAGGEMHQYLDDTYGAPGTIGTFERSSRTFLTETKDGALTPSPASLLPKDDFPGTMSAICRAGETPAMS